MNSCVYLGREQVYGCHASENSRHYWTARSLTWPEMGGSSITNAYNEISQPIKPINKELP